MDKFSVWVIFGKSGYGRHLNDVFSSLDDARLAAREIIKKKEISSAWVCDCYNGDIIEEVK